MTRRCSHCSNNGHNSRTCPSRGASAGTCAGPANGSLTIFGVKLTDGSIMKKSASMGNLSSHFHSSSSSAAVSPNPGSPSSDHLRADPLHLPDGYLSDDPAHRSSSSNRRIERKRGHPWTEDEHRLFLLGLQTLGKGDWRGISRNFVTSRTPTQVASHAQKYFIRQSNATRRKRRSSLFDIVPEMDCAPPTIEEEEEDHAMLPPSGASETAGSNSLPSLKLSLSREFDEPMETISDENKEETRETLQPSLETATMVPALLPAYLPVALTLWPSMTDLHTEENVNEVSHHEVLRPIPVLPKEPVNLNELVGMSQLSLGEAEMDHKDPSQLTLNLLGTPSRPSAFHASTPTRVSNMTEGKSNVIQTAR